MKLPLTGKVAVITGGGRGIGAACARLFVERGAQVVIASRTQAELETVVKDLSLDGFAAQILAVPSDVSNESSVKELFEKTRQHFGAVSILINNAAVIQVQPISEHSVEAWDLTMAVNLRGPFLCSREAFRQMTTTGLGGSIVNLSSLGGIRGTEKFTGFCSYSVSKFGMIGLTECMAAEGRPHGIRVNCVAPGAVDTVMLKQAAPFLKTKTTPQDVAKSIYFLADDSQSGAVTGTVIEIHSNL